MREVHVSNVPYAATENDLKTFLEIMTKSGAVSLCELKRESFNSVHKGFGFVMFEEDEMAERLRYLSSYPYELRFQGRSLRINISKRPVKHNPEHSTMRVEGSGLSMGCLIGDTMHTLWSTDLTVCPFDQDQNTRFQRQQYTTQRLRHLETEIDFREKKLTLKLELECSVNERSCNDEESELNSSKENYKLEFRFKGIYSTSNAKVRGRPAGSCSLLLEVRYPPNVYVEEGGERSLEDLFDFMNCYDVINPRATKPTWVRTEDFTPDYSIGQSSAYLIDFRAATAEVSKALENMADFRHSGADIRLLDLEGSFPYADTERCTNSAQILVPLMKCPEVFNLSFKVMFKLNSLVQAGKLLGPAVIFWFFKLLADAPEEHALWVLEGLTPYSGNPCKELKRGLKNIRTGVVRIPSSLTRKPDDGTIWVYRLLVSPTKVYCMGPEPEVSNRVTRQYREFIDNFLRVSFIEEDFTSLSSQALSYSDGRNGVSHVYERILKILRCGLSLHGKYYEFLAFSSSQLREQSVWMFAGVGEVNASSIRQWMGNFLDIRNVAKCAARMGQCFSSTTKTLPVNGHEVELIADIMSADGQYCFSDGIGMISMPFAKKVAAKCGRHGMTPSAFQIRYAGSKGVVGLSHDCLDKLRIRPSMKKFESDHFDLEVISWTKRQPCYLNRQVITLLSTLGIADHVFEDMQDLILTKLNEMVASTVVALDVLQMTSSGETHRITIQMLKAGYRPTSEPYLQSLLQAFRAFQLLELRTKSRILVSKGRTMMGCLDEHCILKYGQVFLRISSFPGNRSFLDDGLQYLDDGTCVLMGPVVVAKNPCLHPGDVRVLYAVDVPELHHMVDCVVFPQQGHRPHPNECSGSDLDGDLYFVTWDDKLIPEQMSEPMDYSPPEVAVHPSAVSIRDIHEFFVQYMRSDSLGLIANAHVVHADKEPDMAQDPKCLELARLFMVAVDFPKTGKPALMAPTLRATSYPDFMEKDDKVSYESQRVLGKLFRSVVGEVRGRTLTSTISRDDIIQAFDHELMWPGLEVYIGEACIIKSWYDAQLVGLMNQYEIKCEAQALSGNILPLSKFYVKKQGELRDRIHLAVKGLQTQARNWFKHGIEDQTVTDHNPPAMSENDLFAKASAWYYVTYHPSQLRPSGDDGNNVYLLSFPWVVHDTLLTMKKKSRARSQTQ